MNWKQQIEAQIEDLREEAINYGGGRAYGQHLDDTADTMQALLDVAVAADAWRQSDDPGHSSACSEDSFCEVSYAYCEACELRDALDKLREVLMSDLIERIDHDIDGCDDEVCDSCDLLRDCRAEIERLQKRNALLEDVAAALEIERNWSPVAADPFGDHEALDCAIRDTDAALDKLREVSDE